MTQSIFSSVTEAVMGKQEEWWQGRQVVLRNDVPGKRFNPEDSHVLRTDEDRALASLALDAVSDQIRVRDGRPPEWLIDPAVPEAPEP